jgi:hypothetical protein
MTEEKQCILCCKCTATGQVTYCETCAAQVQLIIGEIMREQQTRDNINEMNILGEK